MSQLIISISREFGSGGHEIGEILAKKFDLPLYDNNLLKELTDEKNLDFASLKQYDELPKKRLFSRTVRGFSNSPEENIAKLQFDYLKSMAEKGDSFVVVGRCSETVLKDFDCLVPIFILGDLPSKIERIKTKYNLSENDAIALINKRNAERKAYHNHNCEVKWGDSRNYDISINSSKLGVEKTADFLEMYIREKLKK
jgi:cytidylate kinase